MADAAETKDGNGTGETADEAADSGSRVTSELHALIDRLEGRVRKLVDETGQDTLADGRRQIQENPLTAVLVALGLGLLVGLILGGRRG